MMLSAIISDTVLFRSPTTTDEDKAAVKELAEIAGVDYEAYGMEMLKAGADISDYPAEKLAHNDTKEFEAGGKVFSCGQISVMDLEQKIHISGLPAALKLQLKKLSARKRKIDVYIFLRSCPVRNR